MDYSKWAKEGMDFMADKHRGQHHNMKNVMSKNRHYFSHLKQTLLGQFDDAFRQMIDFLFAMEWAAQDYMRDEHVPRFERAEEEEPWMPSLFGRRVYASEANQAGGLIMDVPRRCRRPRVPNDEGTSSRRRRTVPPPSPTQVHITDDDLAWLERTFGDRGDSDSSEERGYVEVVKKRSKLRVNDTVGTSTRREEVGRRDEGEKEEEGEKKEKENGSGNEEDPEGGTRRRSGEGSGRRPGI